MDYELGKEGKDSRVVLCLLEGPNWQTDDWFKSIQGRTFENEREVEYFFAIRPIQELGYDENELALQLPVTVHIESNAAKTKADIVIFRCGDRSEAVR